MPYRALAIGLGRLLHEKGGKAIVGVLAAIGLALARLFGHGSDKKSDAAKSDVAATSRVGAGSADS